MSIKDYYFIFDLDGTIANTLPDIIPAVNYMLKKAGISPKDPYEIERSIGSGIEEVVKKLTNFKDYNKIKSSVNDFRVHYEEHLIDNTSLYDGVMDFLKKTCFAGSIITNKPEYYAKNLVRKLGILDYFDICIGGLERFPHKPDSSSTKFVMNTYSGNRKTIFVGDSPIDQQTGANADIIFCFAEYGYSTIEEKNNIKYDHILKKFIDINKIFI